MSHISTEDAYYILSYVTILFNVSFLYTWTVLNWFLDLNSVITRIESIRLITRNIASITIDYIFFLHFGQESPYYRSYITRLREKYSRISRKIQRITYHSAIILQMGAKTHYSMFVPLFPRLFF